MQNSYANAQDKNIPDKQQTEIRMAPETLNTRHIRRNERIIKPHCFLIIRVPNQELLTLFTQREKLRQMNAPT